MLAPTDSATPQSPGELRGRCEYLGVNGNSNSSRQCEWIDALRRRRSPAAFRVRYERRDTGEVAGGSTDRKSAVEGKRVSVRVDLGGRRIIKKKKEQQNKNK